jgi:hypothetical protein
MMVSDSGDQIADPGPHQHTDPFAQGADPGPNNEQYSFIRVLKLLSWISTNHIPYAQLWLFLGSSTHIPL